MITDGEGGGGGDQWLSNQGGGGNPIITDDYRWGNNSLKYDYVICKRSLLREIFIGT